MTDIFVLDRAGLVLPEEAAELLPAWRRERFRRLKQENARQESLCAGLLYVYAVASRGIPADEAVTVRPAGKPVFRDREDVFFSLSHSGRYVLCAVSDAPVGADVQERRPARQGIARWFHPAERAWLEALDPAEQETAFFRLWTRKEAWVKAVSGERMLSLAEADVLRPPEGLFFRDFTLPGGYAAAVCGQERELPELTYAAPEDLRPAENK